MGRFCVLSCHTQTKKQTFRYSCACLALFGSPSRPRQGCRGANVNSAAKRTSSLFRAESNRQFRDQIEWNVRSVPCHYLCDMVLDYNGPVLYIQESGSCQGPFPFLPGETSSTYASVVSIHEFGITVFRKKESEHKEGVLCHPYHSLSGVYLETLLLSRHSFV